MLWCVVCLEITSRTSTEILYTLNIETENKSYTRNRQWGIASMYLCLYLVFIIIWISLKPHDRWFDWFFFHFARAKWRKKMKIKKAPTKIKDTFSSMENTVNKCLGSGTAQQFSLRFARVTSKRDIKKLKKIQLFRLSFQSVKIIVPKNHSADFCDF